MKSFWWPGGCLNIKMLSYQYKASHVKDKMVSPTVLSLTWESPYLGKTVFILRPGPGSLYCQGLTMYIKEVLIFYKKGFQLPTPSQGYKMLRKCKYINFLNKFSRTMVNEASVTWSMTPISVYDKTSRHMVTYGTDYSSWWHLSKCRLFHSLLAQP